MLYPGLIDAGGCFKDMLCEETFQIEITKSYGMNVRLLLNVSAEQALCPA